MSAEIDYIAVLADLKAKRAKLDVMIEGLEDYLSMSGIGASSLQRVSGANDIPSDAFLTLALGDAAKKYLGMVRKIQSIPQIVEALKQGGLHHAKTNAVYTALVRREDKVGDVIKADDNNWGLNEWYATNPNIKRKQKPVKYQENPITSNTESTSTAPAPPSRSGITILDACEQILHKANQSLHAENLVRILASDYGKSTNVKSIAGSLPGDAKRRFENLGRNVWTLAEWPESIKNQGQKENRLPL